MKFPTSLLLGCMTVVGLLLNVSAAQAASCPNVTPSTVLAMSNIIIPRGTPNGAPLPSLTVSSGSIDSFKCGANDSTYTSSQLGIKGYGTASAQIGGRNVFLLGNSGIGYTLAGRDYNNCTGVVALYITVDPNTIMCGGTYFTGQPVKGGITVNFYKVGDIKPGNVASQMVGAVIFKLNGSWISPEAVVRTSAFTVTSQGCSLTNTNVVVPMGTINSSQFSGVGSTTEQKDFSIPLDCDSGTKLAVTISSGGAGSWNAASGLINLDAPSSGALAGGVKLQILSNNKPVALNTPLSLGAIPTAGAFNIPLQARYYQSASTVTAGQANASATFIFTYD